jgi:hypothetical protein
MGGLRVRAAQDQRLTTAANLRLAAQLGAALTLLLLVANSLANVTLIWVHIYAPYSRAGYLFASGLLGLAAVVAAWFAPRPVVVPLAAAAAAATAYVSWAGVRAMAIVPVVLMIMLAMLVSLGERMPRSWLWLAGALFAANVLLPLTPLGLLFLYSPLVLVLGHPGNRRGLGIPGRSAGDGRGHLHSVHVPRLSRPWLDRVWGRAVGAVVADAWVRHRRGRGGVGLLLATAPPGRALTLLPWSRR